MNIENTIGNTPLVELGFLNTSNNNSRVLLKLEGNNPAGSVKDRPALNMLKKALERGEINQQTNLIEATSGNTGIALAMVAAIYRIPLTLIMPEDASDERQDIMKAFGAKLILVSKQESMEGARNLADKMEQDGEGVILNQFANDDNWKAHYYSTAPELWQQTQQGITHFVSSMGTTGTIMGCSRYLKEKNPALQIIGVQPTEGAQIPGIRRWSEAYIPKFYNASRVDEIIDVDQQTAEAMTLKLAREEGIFAGISSGGALHIALTIAQQNPNAVVVSIACDRGDRYLSTKVFA